MSVDIIGDEIHYGGLLVAVIAPSGANPSVLAEFEHGMLNATLFEGCGDPGECQECHEHAQIHHLHDCSQFRAEDEFIKREEAYDALSKDVMANIKPFVKGGLLRLTDLERIIAQLKEEGPDR